MVVSSFSAEIYDCRCLLAFDLVTYLFGDKPTRSLIVSLGWTCVMLVSIFIKIPFVSLLLFFKP